MNSIYITIMFAATFLSAVSQILLKKSASMVYRKPIYEYFNWRVFIAYFIFLIVLFSNTYAYTNVDMKYGAVIDSCTYVLVMLLSWMVLGEMFTKWKLVGNIIIIFGIIIYMA